MNDATTKPKSEMIHGRIHLIALAYEAGTCVRVVLDWAIQSDLTRPHLKWWFISGIVPQWP